MFFLFFRNFFMKHEVPLKTEETSFINDLQHTVIFTIIFMQYVRQSTRSLTTVE